MKHQLYIPFLCATAFLAFSCTNDKKQNPHFPGPPVGMVQGEDISFFGVELDDTPLPLTEVENEQIETSPSASNYMDYVENTQFNKQVEVTFSGNKATVAPSISGVSVNTIGADVSISSSATGVEYIVKGSTDNGSLSISSPSNVKISLSGCHVKNPDGSAISVTSAPYTYIVLASDDNYLEDGFVLKESKKNLDPDDDGAANYSIDDLKKQSKQQAKANASGVKKKKNSIKGTVLTEHNLVFSGRGKLHIECNSKSGIRADEEVVFRPGNVIHVKSHEGKGVSAKTGILVYGGVLNVDASNSSKRGISSKGVLAINGGRVCVLSSGGEKCEGIESKGVMLLNGGDICVAASDDAINSSEDLVVNGGRIYACSSANDGLDANGNLIINGGTVAVSGGRAPECGLDANEEDGFRLYIHGGSVIATGGNHTTPSEKSRQASIIYGGALDSTGCIGVASGEDHPLLTLNLKRNYGKMGGQVLFSSEQIILGSPFTIVKGNAINQEDTFFGLTITPDDSNFRLVEKTDVLKSQVTKIGTFPAPPSDGPMPPQ